MRRWQSLCCASITSNCCVTQCLGYRVSISADGVPNVPKFTCWMPKWTRPLQQTRLRLFVADAQIVRTTRKKPARRREPIKTRKAISKTRTQLQRDDGLSMRSKSRYSISGPVLQNVRYLLYDHCFRTARTSWLVTPNPISQLPYQRQLIYHILPIQGIPTNMTRKPIRTAHTNPL